MRFFITMFTFLLTSTLLSQDNVLRICGYTKSFVSTERLSKCKITVYKGGLFMKSIFSANNGAFDTTFPIGGIYELTFERKGYVSKYLTINTNDVEEDDITRGEIPIHFEISLFRINSKVDFTFLDSIPVAEFKYDVASGYMNFDSKNAKMVAEKIRKKMEEVFLIIIKDFTHELNERK